MDKVKDTLIEFILKKADVNNKEEIPLDKSLLAEGILDSFGVIELVEYIENKWKIVIEDNEFTLETMGSINKMIKLINSKAR